MKKPKTKMYFTTVLVINKGQIIFGGHLDIEGTEPTMTRLIIYLGGGQWAHFGDIDDIVYGVSKKLKTDKISNDIAAFIGRKGFYREREVKAGSMPIDMKIDIEGAGYLLDITNINRVFYACGGQRQVHKQIGAKWIKIDTGAFVPLSDDEYVSFEAIDGFSDDDIYAVGWPGDIWHYDGKLWSQLESPTNYPLFCVLCNNNGDVYIGGSNGLIFKGGKDKGWSNLSDSGVTTETLERMTEFQGKIYITASEKLVWTDGGQIQEVNIPIEGYKAFNDVDSIDRELWSVGDDCILQFDGKKWQKHICPENV